MLPVSSLVKGHVKNPEFSRKGSSLPGDLYDAIFAVQNVVVIIKGNQILTTILGEIIR